MILDYGMMQWILSIVIGITLSRVISSVALLARKRKLVKFDFLLTSNLLVITINIVNFWFRSPEIFNSVEGKYIPFMLFFITIVIFVTAVEALLPTTSLLESDNVIDLKEAYFNQKNLYYLAMLSTGVVTLSLYIFYPEVKGFALGLESRIIEIPLLIVLTIILPGALILSSNYYLHGFNMILLLGSLISEVIMYSSKMR